MADLIKQLTKKGDSTTKIFPNIKSDNIPDGAITTDKIDDNAVTSDKIASSSITRSKLVAGVISSNELASDSVTTTKILDDSITEIKLASNSVSNDKIQNNAITNEKINDNEIERTKLSTFLQNFINQLNHTYNIYMGDENDTILLNIGTTTLSDISDYSTEDFTHAFDFDKAQADITLEDLSIYKMIIDGMNFNNKATNDRIEVRCSGITMSLIKSTNYSIYCADTSHTFLLEFDNDLNIITYTNTMSYIYMYLRKVVNNDITNYE